MTTRLSAIDFATDIARLTENFTGRQWVFDKIDLWLQESEERFLILVGEPGFGKGATIARLTQIRKDVAAYHFCRAGDVETVRPERILRSLAAQLGNHLPGYGEALANTIKPFHLHIDVSIKIASMRDSEVTGVVIENLKPSDPENELDILIRAPLEELQKVYAERQETPPLAIILINSLDEAITTTGTNLVELLTQLSKSTSLPPWVRFVMTSRSERQVLRGFEPLRPCYIPEKLEEDLALSDIRCYVENRVAQSALLNNLQDDQVKPHSLIEQITNLSHGNFLYTILLLNDIEAGHQALDDLAALPKSIDEIYHGFLSRFNEKDWSGKYKPILGLLTVAQEPISEEQISNYTGMDLGKVRASIRIARQFFYVDIDEQNKEVYSIFHQSFRDYLLNKDRNPDFWCDEQEQHQQIIGFYEGTSRSWQELKPIDHYGLLHLPKHLTAAGLEEELYTLLIASPDWMNRKREVLGRDRPYIHDLELAIDQLNDPSEADQLLMLIKLYAARQVVHQRSSSYSDIDLETLVRLGQKDKALEYARSRAGNTRKVEALLTIHEVFREKTQLTPDALDESREVLNEAVQIVSQIDESWEQTGDLRRKLAIALAKAERFDEAEDFANGIDKRQEIWAKADALRELAVIFSQIEDTKKDLLKARKIFEKAEQLIRLIEGDQESAVALGQLAISLAKAKEGEYASRIFEEAEQLLPVANGDGEYVYLAMLRELAVALAQAGESQKANEIFKKAEQLTCKQDDLNDLGQLRELAVAFAQAGNTEKASAVLNKVESLTRRIPAEDDGQVMPLYELAVVFARTNDMKRAQEVLGEAENSIGDAWGKAKILLEFAKALAKAGFVSEAAAFLDKTGMATRNLQNNWARIDVLKNLAVALAQVGSIPKARDVFKEAEKLSSTAENEVQREQSLNKWAVVLAMLGFYQKAIVTCTDVKQLQLFKKEMLSFKQYGERVRSRADLIAQSGMLNGWHPYIENLNRAETAIQVREIADDAIASEKFTPARNLSVLSVLLAVEGRYFNEARKVANAIIEAEEKQIALNELSRILAWNGRFKEAFSVRGLKNGVSQFLDDLVIWMYGSEEVEQKPLIEILQGTLCIFGWTYPPWEALYQRLLSDNSEGKLLQDLVLSLEDRDLEEDSEDDTDFDLGMESRNLVTIASEQFQQLEDCVRQAVTILYHSIPEEDLIAFESPEKAVLADVYRIASAQITLLVKGLSDH